MKILPFICHSSTFDREKEHTSFLIVKINSRIGHEKNCQATFLALSLILGNTHFWHDFFFISDKISNEEEMEGRTILTKLKKLCVCVLFVYLVCCRLFLITISNRRETRCTLWKLYIGQIFHEIRVLPLGWRLCQSRCSQSQIIAIRCN